jgi:phage portal protein BeeE
MGKGAKADPFGADISNAVAVDARRNIVLDICNLFGVPSHYLNVIPTGTSQTYANINDEALSLERFTLGGFVDPIQDVITDLLPDDERRMIIDMREVTRPSQEARFRAWTIALGGKPFMTAEEVRTEEGLPPDGMPEPETTVSEPEAPPEPEATPEDAPAEPEPEKEPAPA